MENPQFKYKMTAYLRGFTYPIVVFSNSYNNALETIKSNQIPVSSLMFEAI